MDDPLYVTDPSMRSAGNRVRAQRDGAQAFPAWLEAIEQARERISIEMYIFASDGIGQRFADALARAAARGVTVRLLYDFIGCRDTDPAMFQRLRAAGVQTIVYHRVHGWRPRFWKLFRRNHRKTLVVDGRRGFTGGLNISDAWVAPEQGGKGWLDLAVEIQGPAVAALERPFAATWNRRSRKRHRLHGIVPPPPAGDSEVAIIANTELRERFTIRRSVLHAIRLARARVWVANAYFIPDRGILRALRRSARAGLDVRVLLSHRTDSRVVDHAVRAHLGPLLHDGVRVFLHPRFVHSKVMLTDDRFVSVGTYNLDHRSLSYNLELVANTLSPELNTETARILAEDMAAADEIAPARFARRPPWQRLLEWLAYLLRRWL